MLDRIYDEVYLVQQASNLTFSRSTSKSLPRPLSSPHQHPAFFPKSIPPPPRNTNPYPHPHPQHHLPAFQHHAYTPSLPYLPLSLKYHNPSFATSTHTPPSTPASPHTSPLPRPQLLNPRHQPHIHYAKLNAHSLLRDLHDVHAFPEVSDRQSWRGRAG